MKPIHFWFLLHILSVVAPANIHVSRDQFSTDTKDCGSISRPCATIQHAIGIALDYDSILLDSKSAFYQYEPLFIDKAINITSYTSTITSIENKGNKNYSFIVFPNDSAQPNMTYAFAISSILSMSFLRIRIQSLQIEYMLFVLQGSFGDLNVTYCYIETRTYSIITDVYIRGNFTLHFSDTIFKEYTVRPTRLYQNAYKELDNPIIPGIFVYFRDCQFYSTSYRFSVATVMEFTNCTFNQTVLMVPSKASTFNYCRFYSSTIAFNLDISTTIINHTVFDGSSGGVSQVQVWGENNLTVHSCILKNALHGSLRVPNGIVSIKNTTFCNNSLMAYSMWQENLNMPGVVAFPNFKRVEIDNCTFRNNVAPVPQTGSIHAVITDNWGRSALFTMKDTLIIAAAAQATSEKSIVVYVSTNFQFLTSVQFFNVEFRCPKNHKESFKMFTSFGPDHATNINSMLFICNRCDSLSYNIKDIAKVSWGNTSYFIPYERNTMCLPCPVQASCINYIRGKGNYLGFSDTTGVVSFILCPALYCCTSLATCASYNTCANNRRGTLCGDCLEEHSISVFGHNRCVLNEDCKSSIFWIGYVVAVIFTIMFVLYSRDFLELVKHVFSRKGQPEHGSISVVSNERDSPYTLIEDTDTPDNPKQEGFVSGLIKIAFFFYQAASIIRINASAKTVYRMPFVIDALTSFFNVKIDAQLSTGISFCPMYTNNVVIIEALRTSVILACLLLLLSAVFVLHCIAKCKYVAPEESLDTETPEGGMSNMTRFKGAYLQLLLIGYSSIAVFCLQTVKCIDIDGSSYLFLQATTECYQPWQTIMAVIISTWVVPFPLAIYIGCRLLRAQKSTVNGFLFMITFPPAALYYCVKSLSTQRHHTQSSSLQELEYHLLGILNEPFRLSSNDNNLKLIWEPILIFRRLALVIASTFILSPIEKLYPIGALLLLFTLHDIFTIPYVDGQLNYIQLYSMFLLILLTLVNMFWSFSNDIDISMSPQYYNLGKVFLLLEISILLLPFILLSCTLLYKFGRFLYKRVTGKQE